MAAAEEDLHRALVRLTGSFNRPQADAALLREAGSSLDRALLPLLVRVGGLGPITISELADTVSRHYSTVSRQVTTLEQQRYVVRAMDESDRRRSIVEVTDNGRDEIARIARARNEAMRAIFTGWLDQDRNDLTRPG